MAVPTAAATTSAVSAAVTATAPVIVQYIAIRRDLLKTLKWTFGSVATQACHASSAAIWTFRKHPCTEEYLSDEQIDRMHKVVVEVRVLVLFCIWSIVNDLVRVGLFDDWI
ncbi:hypothetical protein CAOG_005427 [Capsaspora owczarzaki ATCC 30864]|uniref:peptidyl-tRNA hydrolase n=1 Tax=Capsaspora owczarzaki (strain ATCC 30864) TaxID=595528 RepID=A0A0D2UI97_CAPO3|nr:hypothetical protein CAOG_005427 [Capsaspora owczarzaki ATCC 30864]